MITRRKLATVVASALGAVGLGGGATIASTPQKPELFTFEALQQWFRNHPDLLWSHRTATTCELVRQQAVRLSEPFAEAHPHIEYDAWVDNCTDNVLMKIYHRTPRDENNQRREIGLAMCITRRDVVTGGPELEDAINKGWEALTVACNEARFDPNSEFNKPEGGSTKIMGLAEMKQTGGT